MTFDKLPKGFLIASLKNLRDIVELIPDEHRFSKRYARKTLETLLSVYGDKTK